ncbi:uncharacterized protein [Dysidea avara]|uniref:uncharacterized protein n=1 Tax=Dysidea avara TaxID=196820 RepID=UPI00332F7F44
MALQAAAAHPCYSKIDKQYSLESANEKQNSSVVIPVAVRAVQGENSLMFEPAISAKHSKPRNAVSHRNNLQKARQSDSQQINSCQAFSSNKERHPKDREDSHGCLLTKLGPGALLAKMDIKSAFRLLPVHPADRHLLAMEWNGGIYIDTCLPFSLRSASKLLNILADLFSWLLDQQGASPTIHYLDNFLTMGPAGDPTCFNNLNKMTDIAKYLGIPLAMEKLEVPSHCLTFLGIALAMQKM